MLEILTAAVLLLASGQPSCATSDRRIEEVIRAKVARLGGHEYCQFRMYEALSDLDSDGTDDLVVVFSIEGPGGGGNDTIQFVAAFASGNGWQPSVLEVGRRGERMVEGITTVGHSVIRLATLQYGPSDARCCPTQRQELRLSFNGGKIGLAQQ